MNKTEEQLCQFIKNYEKKVIPLYKTQAKDYFQATKTGKPQDYKKVSESAYKMSQIFTNKAEFKELKSLKDSGQVKEPLLKRQLTYLYNSYLFHQVDKKKIKRLIEMEIKIEKKFNTFRASIDNKKVTENKIKQILEKSENSLELEKAWLANKQVGKVVASDVLKLIKLRNEIAKQLGFSDYHTMSLTLNEQDPKEIEDIFDKLDELIKDDFKRIKETVIDPALARRYKIAKRDLQPWHYQDVFFQQVPKKIYDLQLDEYYKDLNVVALSEKYYQSIGLQTKDIIRKSDLYERPGKYQSAYCIDIDKAGDVRIMASVKPTFYWATTMLHELGHAVYDKNFDNNLPWILKSTDISLTEAVAMFFQDLGYNPKWMEKMLKVPKKEIEKISKELINYACFNEIIFSRWAQVMYRFEKSIYQNPDQDANALWWRLVQKYQLLKKPIKRDEPDWAAKKHIVTSPAYYHNYQLGALLAAQFYWYLTVKVFRKKSVFQTSFTNDKRIGKYFVDRVFSQGARFYWNDLIKFATGEKLNPKYFSWLNVKNIQL